MIICALNFFYTRFAFVFQSPHTSLCSISTRALATHLYVKQLRNESKTWIEEICMCRLSNSATTKHNHRSSMLIVGCELTSTPNVCSFFSSAHTGKETADIWWVCKIASYKKHGEGEKSKQRKSFFAMLEITMASSSGFLIL